MRSEYPPEDHPELYQLHGESAVDRIYVYPGSVATQNGPSEDSVLSTALMQINWNIQASLNPLSADEADPLTVFNSLPGVADLPTNWAYQVR